MAVEFTSSGYIEVWRDGVKVSQHRQEREAVESVSRHAYEGAGNGDYELRYPTVMAKVYGVLASDAGDTEAPTIPQNLSATATSATTIDLSWDASTDNVAVTSYNILRDSVPLITISHPQTIHTDTSLTPNTLYSYEVTASDAAGNSSALSASDSATTLTNAAPVWNYPDQNIETGNSYSQDLNGVCTDADLDTITFSEVGDNLSAVDLTLSGSTISGTPATTGTPTVTLRADDGITFTDEAVLFTVTAPDVTAPDPPANLTANAPTFSAVNLDWDDNVETDLDHYVVYRSLDGAAYSVIEDPVLVSTYQDTNVNASTNYWYKVTAVDTSTNESGDSNVATVTTPDVQALQWVSEPDITLSAAVTTYDLLDDVNFPNLAFWFGVDSSSATSEATLDADGVTLEGAKNNLVTYNSIGPVISRNVTFNVEDDATTGDWLARSTGDGVVWAHDFSNSAEVDQFRWTGGYGNDPGELGGRAGTCVHDAADGITGGSLVCQQTAPSSLGQSVSDWWRPMARISGAQNGRGIDDPGVGGALPLEPFDSSDPNETFQWPGNYYGNPFYHTQPLGSGGPGSAFETAYDRFFFQMRVKIDPTILTALPSQGGKLLYFSTTYKSLTLQEIVTIAHRPASPANGNNHFGMYRGGSSPLWDDAPGQNKQPGGEVNGVGSLCNWSTGSSNDCWTHALDDTWDTYTYEVVPGLSSNADTIVRVWGARQGQNTYTKIWDQSDVNLGYSTEAGDPPVQKPWGINAAICSAFYFGAPVASAWFMKYAQIVFSTEMIPCPQDF